MNNHGFSSGRPTPALRSRCAPAGSVSATPVHRYPCIVPASGYPESTFLPPPTLSCLPPPSLPLISPLCPPQLPPFCFDVQFLHWFRGTSTHAHSGKQWYQQYPHACGASSGDGSCIGVDLLIWGFWRGWQKVLPSFSALPKARTFPCYWSEIGGISATHPESILSACQACSSWSFWGKLSWFCLW